MAFAANMIASLKLNNRRKSNHSPFSKDKKKYTTGEAIKSKKFTQLEKDILSKKLKEKKEIEREQNKYKLVISFGVTVLVISGIVFTIKLIFF